MWGVPLLADGSLGIWFAAFVGAENHLLVHRDYNATYGSTAFLIDSATGEYVRSLVGAVNSVAALPPYTGPVVIPSFWDSFRNTYETP
ncbi:hypothetical protein D3C84_1134730 [compost metagenome]